MPLATSRIPASTTTCMLGGTVLCLALATPQAQADETTASLYLWGTDVDQTLEGGTRLETSRQTVMENLEFGLMGTLVHRRGPWLYGFDGLYADIGKDGDVDVPVESEEPDGPDAIEAALDFTTRTTMAHAFVGHEWYRDANWSVYGTGGIRYTRFDTDLTVETDDGARRFDTEDNLTDATFGLRGHYSFTPRWSTPFIVDVGTGSTEISLQAFTAAEYAWGASSVTAGYRYMKWRLDDSDFLEEVIYEGPVVAYSYRF
ncbi:hypothetical protein [Halomonas sp. HG01]|uniref:hypothetical protein n=1 Tax=Halomonas sp. HG01 TaxID=1609967 RepID=UPI00061455F6|nr:hypothetical protein [Halomonas sp. HG01]